MPYYEEYHTEEWWVPNLSGSGHSGPIFYGYHFKTKEIAKKHEIRYTAQPLYMTYRTDGYNHNNDDIISCKYCGMLVTSNLYGTSLNKYKPVTGFDVRKGDTIVAHFDGSPYRAFKDALNFIDKMTLT